MPNHLPLVLVTTLSLGAACGDNAPAQPDPDAAPEPADAAAPDALVCDLTSYPPAVRMLTVDLQQPFELTLDGVGTRCDQLVRALTDPDPSKRPAELAELDVDDVISSCSYDAQTKRDIVRLQAPRLAGLPVFGVIQDAIVHVEAPAIVVYLHGDYLPPLRSPVNPSCLGPDAVRATVPGSGLTYSKFALCALQGEGSYAVASEDVIEVGEEGYLLDRDGFLRRVRAVDVYLAPGHVTAEHINSDLYCCQGPTLERCVGARVFVDALTGEVVHQQQHCHAC